MGPGETLAAIALAGVAIGLIIAGTQMFKSWIAYKEAQLGSRGDQAALEERIRVLERILTERHSPLADEIEALRHTPADAGVPLAFSKEHV
jgi:hypothetical protein